MVDTERDDLDPFPVCPIELHELVDLDRTRGEQSVRATDDLRLGSRPSARFRAFDLFRARLGLHPVQGVERRYERQPEAVLDRMTSQTRQPVVGMDGIRGRVTRAEHGMGRARHPVDDRFGELLDVVLKCLLGDRDRRPAATWCTAKPGSTATTSGRSSDQRRV